MPAREGRGTTIGRLGRGKTETYNNDADVQKGQRGGKMKRQDNEENEDNDTVHDNLEIYCVQSTRTKELWR